MVDFTNVCALPSTLSLSFFVSSYGAGRSDYVHLLIPYIIKRENNNNWRTTLNSH